MHSSSPHRSRRQFQLSRRLAVGMAFSALIAACASPPPSADSPTDFPAKPPALPVDTDTTATAAVTAKPPANADESDSAPTIPAPNGPREAKPVIDREPTSKPQSQPEAEPVAAGESAAERAARLAAEVVALDAALASADAVSFDRYDGFPLITSFEAGTVPNPLPTLLEGQGITIAGALGDSPFRLGSGAFADVVELPVKAGERYGMALDAEVSAAGTVHGFAFDALVAVFWPDGNQAANARRSPENPNAWLDVIAPMNGVAKIVTSSRQAGERGAYTLKIWRDVDPNAVYFDAACKAAQAAAAHLAAAPTPAPSFAIVESPDGSRIGGPTANAEYERLRATALKWLRVDISRRARHPAHRIQYHRLGDHADLQHLFQAVPAVLPAFPSAPNGVLPIPAAVVQSSGYREPERGPRSVPLPRPDALEVWIDACREVATADPTPTNEVVVWRLQKQMFQLQRDLRSEAICAQKLGVERGNLGQFDAEMAEYRHAIQILRRLPNRSDEGLMWYCVGVALHRRNQFADALPVFEWATEILAAAGNTLSEATCEAFCAECLEKLGHFADAISRYQRAANKTAEPRQAGICYGRIAMSHLELEQFGNAYEAARRALQIQERIPAARSDMPVPLMAIAKVEIQRGHLQSALAHTERAAEIEREIGNVEGLLNTEINRGVILDRMGRRREALVVAEQALEMARKTEILELMVVATNNLAGIHGNMGNWPAAREIALQGLALIEKLPPSAETNRRKATLLLNLAIAAQALGQIDEARKYIDMARAILANQRRSTELGFLHQVFGNQLLQQGIYSAAIDEFSAALAAYDSVEAASAKIRVWRMIAKAQMKLGQIEAAEVALKTALELAGTTHVIHLGEIHGAFGQLYETRGDFIRAMDHYQRSLAICRQIPDRSGELAALGGFGDLFVQLGQPDVAITHYDAAIAIARDNDLHRDLATLLGNRAIALSFQQKFELARESNHESRRIFEHIGYPPGVLMALSNEATFLHKLGRLDDALVDADAAVRAAVELKELDEGTVRFNLSHLLLDMGRIEAAKREFARAEQIFHGAGALHLRMDLARFRLKLHLYAGEWNEAVEAAWEAQEVAAAYRPGIPHAARGAFQYRDADIVNDAIVALRRGGRPRTGVAAAHDAASLIDRDLARLLRERLVTRDPAHEADIDRTQQLLDAIRAVAVDLESVRESERELIEKMRKLPAGSAAVAQARQQAAVFGQRRDELVARNAKLYADLDAFDPKMAAIERLDRLDWTRLVEALGSDGAMWIVHWPDSPTRQQARRLTSAERAARQAEETARLAAVDPAVRAVFAAYGSPEFAVETVPAHVVVIVVTADSAELIDAGPVDQFRRFFEVGSPMHAALIDGAPLHPREWAVQARQLMRMLVGGTERWPLLSAKRCWIVVPDGPLYHFPLAALIAPTTADADVAAIRNYHHMPFLVHSHAITYAPSPAAFLQLLELETTARPAARGAAFVGLPDYGSRESAFGIEALAARYVPRGLAAWISETAKHRHTERMHALRSGVPSDDSPATPAVPDDERRLCAALPPDPLDVLAPIAKRLTTLWPDVAMFEQENATETALRTAPVFGQSRLVMIACHGTDSRREPLDGTLLLAPRPGADEHADGLVFVRDIYGFGTRWLNAEIVVLVACRAAGGGLDRGEGANGLPRAFLHAGAARFLGPKWNVKAVAATAFLDALLPKLHANFARDSRLGRTTTAATLAAVQSDFARRRPADGTEFANPHHWAAWTLTGID